MEEENKETTYTKEQIEEYRKKVKDLCYTYPDCFSKMLKTTQQELYNFILQYTKCMRERDYPMSTLCYWVIEGITSWEDKRVRCPTCGKPLKDKDARVKRGYIRPHCSRHCSQADKNVYTKIQQHKNIKYGNSANSNKGALTRKLNHFEILKQNKYTELCCNTFNEYLEIYNTTGIFKFKCKKCGSIRYTKLSNFTKNNENHLFRCYKCFPTLHNRSKAEIEIFEFCKSLCKQKNYHIQANCKNLIKFNRKALELDIVIDDIKFAIEYDGDYYHSAECYNINKNENIKRNRSCLSMLDKTKLVEEKGYQLYHISEFNWNKNKHKILQYLTKKILNNTKLILSNQIEIVDRQIHNLNDKPLNYTLIQILDPIIEVRNGFHVKNCGYLVYKKLNT